MFIGKEEKRKALNSCRFNRSQRGRNSKKFRMGMKIRVQGKISWRDLYRERASLEVEDRCLPRELIPRDITKTLGWGSGRSAGRVRLTESRTLLNVPPE